MTPLSPRNLAAAAILALTAAALLGSASPGSAQAGGPAITVTPSTGLNPAGGQVTVSGTGYAPGQGIYVQLCPKPAGDPGTPGGRATNCNPDQGGDFTIWKTPIDPTGTFTVTLNVKAAFGSADCTSTPCGAFTRRDHIGGGADYSQDVFASVQFATGGPASSSPTTVASSAAPRLAETGAASTTLALVGAGLLAGGTAIVVRSRRQAATT